MTRLLFALLLIFSTFSICRADTIDHFINIYDQIPRMEIKADSQSQAWARSARSVLNITSETVAETLLQANNLAEKQGKPLFCLPGVLQLDATKMTELIVETYRNIFDQQKDQMTVSQIAWLAVSKNYPCKQPVTPPSNLDEQRLKNMEHVSAY